MHTNKMIDMSYMREYVYCDDKKLEEKMKRKKIELDFANSCEKSLKSLCNSSFPYDLQCKFHMNKK